MRETVVILLSIIALVLFGFLLKAEMQGSQTKPALSLPVASAAEAMRLSREDQLGRFFDCLEYEVETSMLQTCEE